MSRKDCKQLLSFCISVTFYKHLPSFVYYQKEICFYVGNSFCTPVISSHILNAFSRLKIWNKMKTEKKIIVIFIMTFILFYLCKRKCFDLNYYLFLVEKLLLKSSLFSSSTYQIPPYVSFPWLCPSPPELLSAETESS